MHLTPSNAQSRAHTPFQSPLETQPLRSLAVSRPQDPKCQLRPPGRPPIRRKPRPARSSYRANLPGVNSGPLSHCMSGLQPGRSGLGREDDPCRWAVACSFLARIIVDTFCPREKSRALMILTCWSIYPDSPFVDPRLAWTTGCPRHRLDNIATPPTIHHSRQPTTSLPPPRPPTLHEYPARQVLGSPPPGS